MSELSSLKMYLYTLKIYEADSMKFIMYLGILPVFLSLRGVGAGSGGRGGGRVVVVVLLLFYVHGKHLRSCRDGQLT